MMSKYHYLVPINIVNHPDPCENKRFLSLGGTVVEFEMDNSKFKELMLFRGILDKLDDKKEVSESHMDKYLKEMYSNVVGFFKFWELRSRIHPTSIHLFHSNEKISQEDFSTYVKYISDDTYKKSLFKCNVFSGGGY